ncbi:MAG: HEAT repeat domain-containing protein [Methanoregulaceae archaeon]|nr:HEAT repeat domain-containing protein [Methanoregulaceae archaeon]
MHDFALVVFQSHGRWGCRDVQSYWITDSTAPFLFVAPALFATLAHAAVESRRRRRDGSLRLPGRRTVAILATVPLVLVVGLLASAQPWRFPPQGPMWQGKAFHEWLDDSNPNVWRDPSVEILQTMETGLLVKTLRTYLNSVNPPSWWDPIFHPNREQVVNSHESPQSQAAYVLGELGPRAGPAFPDLLRATKHPDFNVQSESIKALGKLRLHPEKTLPFLISLLSDASQPVRLAAITAIGNFEEEAKPSFPQWKKALTDENESVRRVAMETLFQVGIPRSTVLPLLKQNLNAPEDRVRESAAYRLGRLGAEGRSALPSMRKLLGDKDPEVQIAAAFSMWRIDRTVEREVAPVVMRWKDHPKPWVQTSAYDALWKMNAQRYGAPIELRKKILSSTNEVLQLKGIELFMERDPASDASWVPVLCRLLKGKEASGEEWVARLLAQMGPVAAAALPDLGRLSVAKDLELRLQVREAIQRIDDLSEAPKEIRELAAALQGKRREEVRDVIVQRLGPPHRHIGSGFRIEQWDLPSGVLTFHPMVGPTFTTSKTKTTFWLMRTMNPVRPSLLGSYEMTTLSDSKNHELQYWIGNVDVTGDLTYRFRDSGQCLDHRQGQAANFFMQHPSGNVMIEYNSPAVTEGTLLESIAKPTVIARMKFRSADEDHHLALLVKTDRSSRTFSFESEKPLCFVLEKQWKSYWP